MSDDQTNSLSGKVGLDTTEYKTGVADLNRQIRVIESGFRASAAAMGEWDKTSEGLTAREKALTQQIEIQKQKIVALNSEYEKMVKEKGADSRAAQELLIKINKQNEGLGKMTTELRGTQSGLEKVKTESQQAGGKIQDLGQKEDETGKKSESFKSKMKGLGDGLKNVGKIAAGVVVGVAGIGAGIGKLFLDTAAASDGLMEMSDKTGLSVEQLQELSYVGKQVGTDVETVTGSMAKMIRNMASAKGGTGAQAEAFKSLGIEVVGMDGKLRSSQAVFAEVIDKLGQMPNETERDAAAMAILGKSAQEINPLIKAGASEIAKLTQEAHTSGAVMSDEAVKGMGDFNDMLDGLKDGLKGTVGTLATAFLPAFQGMSGKAKRYLGQFVNIVKGSGGDMGKAAGGIANLATQMITDSVASAPGLLKAGLGIIQQLITGIIGNLPTLIPAVIAMLMMLVNFIIQMLPILLTAAIQIILALVQGITSALPTLIPAIVQAMITIVQTLVQNLPMLISAALQLLVALAQGLILALPVLIDALPQIVVALVDGLVQNAPMILTAAVTLITLLVFGLIQNLPKLYTAGLQGITGLINVFKTTDWGNIGSQIVTGLGDGFMAQWANFKSNVVSAFNEMVTVIKNLLGIHSPSSLYGWFGKNMALGLGNGFIEEFKSVRRQIVGAMGGMSVAFGGAGGGGSYSSQSQTQNYYAPVIYQNGNGVNGQATQTRRW